MLFVRNLDLMMDFYTNILGFSKGVTVGEYSFLKTANDSHHDLAFCISQEKNNFEHLAFELNSTEDLQDFCTKFENIKMSFERYDYGIGECIYFNDPEGNCLELFVDLRKQRNVIHWNGKFERLN